jgi:hypothetical protein
VEIGAWDGVKLSNTWDLWHNKGWSAVLIEGETKKFTELKELVSEFPEVTPIVAFVDSQGENSLDQLLGRTSIPDDFELLSVDVDGWDYHIWKGLRDYHPKLVVIEYNATFPPHIDFVGAQDDSHFGASALALFKLAKEMGYTFMCCTLSNMFFIRNDIVDGLGVALPTLKQAFRHDHITYVVSTQQGNPFLTQDLPFVGTRGFKGVLAQALPPQLPMDSMRHRIANPTDSFHTDQAKKLREDLRDINLEPSPKLRAIVVVDLNWLRRVIPLLVPVARLARALWRLSRRR